MSKVQSNNFLNKVYYFIVRLTGSCETHEWWENLEIKLRADEIQNLLNG